MTEAEIIYKCKNIFEEIKKGEGAFSLEPLVHASNCIDRQKELASNGIKEIDKFFEEKGWVK